MLTSLEVLEATGISRATLNNYIALNLLPRPVVRNPGKNPKTRARQIGYFPHDTLRRIERIGVLKKEGMSMAEISRQLQLEGFEISQQQTPEMAPMRSEAIAAATPSKSGDVIMETGPLKLTLDQVPYPAYMVNYNLELTWYNEEARSSLLGNFDKLPADIKARAVLEYLARGKYGSRPVNREAFVRIHQQIGRQRTAALIYASKYGADVKPLSVSDENTDPIAELPLVLCADDESLEYYKVYAAYFREGILLIYAHEDAMRSGLLGLLERRDEVIRNLLKKRLPVLTEVVVMVADLQSSTRISSELPPEEYFELINQIWSAMDPIFRRYFGTHGKHVGDGMVYYFFPQPDCNYIFNALQCATEMREAMRKISKQWQLRKNWLNELYLNTGLNEGQEWLGVFHIETRVEFTVLGDTINHAARLSDFARCGSIWATKNLLGKLSQEERQHVRFGVKRQDKDGREVFVSASYSRLSELVDLACPRYEKLYDIAALAITEIVELA